MASESYGVSAASSPSLLNAPELADVSNAGIRNLLRQSGGYADIFAQEIEKSFVSGSLRLDKKILPPVHWESGISGAAGLAVRRLGPKPCFLAANGLDVRAVQVLSEEASNESITRTVDMRLVNTPTETEDDASRAWIREATDVLASAVDECRSIRVGIFQFSIRKALWNSLGHHHFDAVQRTEVRIDVDTPDGHFGHTSTAWGASDPSGIDVISAVQSLVLRANGRRNLTLSIPDVSVLFLPAGWGGVWMHEAVGHRLEAGAVASDENPSIPLGARWADTTITVVDDGTLNPSRVTGTFDDEGVATRRTSLIENGIVSGILTDRVAAAEFNLPLTGNGRRPHFGLPPRPRMTNLLLANGSGSRDELLSAAGTIVVVESIDHAWLDRDLGRLHLRIDAAHLVRNGVVEGSLPPVIASADPRSLLANVAGVASDFAIDLDRGYCVKDGAAVTVTVGQPSVLIRDVAIRPAGTA